MNTYIKISLLAILFFTFSVSNAQVNATNCNPQNNGSAIGLNTTATGNNSFASGESTIANETNSLAFGFNSYATGSNSMAIGYRCNSTQLRAYSLGAYAHSSGVNSVTIGTFIESAANYGMVIGKGNNPDLFLTNNYENSLMIGFNSAKPTFFVGGASGITKTGKIGIGDVTDPQAKLHIKGDENENVEIFLESEGLHTFSKVSFGSQDRYISRNSKNMNFVMHPGESFKFQGGKVGINLGANSPQYELDVAGNINFSGGLYQDGTLFKESPWVHDNYPTSRIIYYGEVAIGEPPSSLNKLSVAGNVLFKGKLTADDVEVKKIEAWKDEVFTPEYKLLSIAETEIYIKENGHLPDLPSEAEVLENGYKLSEMDALLLQKIEELTLFIIEQQKEIEKLKKDK